MLRFQNVPHHASRDDHGRGRAPLGEGAQKSKVWRLVDPLRRDATLGKAHEQAILAGKMPCAHRDEHRAGRLHACPDPVRPAVVPIGEKHPVSFGRGSLKLVQHANEYALVATLPCCLHLGHRFGQPFHRAHITRLSRLRPGSWGGPGGHAVEHVELQLECFQPLDRLALGFGDVTKDHVGPVVDLHPLCPSGVDRHPGRGEEGGRRSHRWRAEARPERDRLWTLRDDRLEHQFVRLFERIPDPLAEPVGLAVKRVKRAKDVDGGVGVADDEHRGFCGRRNRCGDGRRGGDRCSHHESDHPSPSRGEWHWVERCPNSRTNQFSSATASPVPSSHSAHQTPQPGTSKDGHHLIKKCLAKSVKTLRFVGGYPQFGSAGRGYCSRRTLYPSFLSISTTEYLPARWPAPTAIMTAPGCAMRCSIHLLQLALRWRMSASRSAGEVERSRSKVLAMPPTSPLAHALSIPAKSLFIDVVGSIAPSRRARCAGSGRRSKKPNCSTLVSSSPIGLPRAVKPSRRIVSTPSSPLSPSSWNLSFKSTKAAAQVFI